MRDLIEPDDDIIIYSLYSRDVKWGLKTPYATAGNRMILVSPNFLSLENSGVVNVLKLPLEIDVSNAINWDTITPTDYTAASARAGKDFYIYALKSSHGAAPRFILSAASTYPSGYTALNSRKIGGFHCLCVSVGTIASHDLTDFVAGDVLPASIWDLNHKPKVANPEGMVYSLKANIWVGIYLPSGTGASTASVNGGTISDSRDWMDFTDDGAAVNKRMLRDREFQVIAAGCNEGTNIAGDSDPVTTGGHVDTAGRRMISNIGCEDCAGVMHQWLDEQSFRCDPDGSVTAAGLTSTITHDDTPGGNPVYLRQASSGLYYLASNMAAAAVDKYIGPANYKIPVKHEAGAATGAIGQVYFDDDAANAYEKLLCNISTIAKNIFIPTNNPTYFLEIKHDASAATNGTAVNFDDGADNRLESNNAGGANATFDISLNSQTLADYTLPGSKGKLYRQGTYGDVKLIGGRAWFAGSSCGSRGRLANTWRWNTNSILGCQFCAESI
jgi:hypothetical protein